jgi:aryl-alcohol dehydrogenase-like predicted oxidoreductase
MAVRYRRLGDTDLEVPLMVLGCGNFNGIGSTPELFGRGDDEQAAFAVLDSALEHGLTMVDTANSYGGGRSEEWIGRWLTSRGMRDRVLLTTKVGSPVGPRPQDAGLSADHLCEQADASLTRLNTDRIDLYLAHGPDPGTPIEETIAAFGELIRRGTIRYAGLSNFSGAEVAAAVAAADALGEPRPVNLQSGYNLLDPVAARDVFEVCADAGMGFTAYSPLAGGWLTGKYRAGEPFPAGSRMTLRPDWYGHLANDETYRVLDRLDDFAERRGLSLPTVALAWAITDPAVTSLIIGPRSPEQLGRMVAAADVGLTGQDRAELVALTRPAD